MNLAKKIWFLNSASYPEYPGSSLTEAILTYSSVVDPTKTNLKVRIYFPTGKTNLPLCSCIHGFDEVATDMSPSEDLFRRIARTGKFVAAFEMRGSAGSGGTITFTNDAGGRQKFDVRDGEDYIETLYGVTGSTAAGTLAYTGGVMRREIYSQSFGGTVSIGMARTFPDRYVNVTAYFPVVDCTAWDTWLNANGGGARSTLLRSYIGGTPAAKPDEWATRNGNNVSNILSEMFFAADTGDTSVPVTESQGLATALSSAGKTYTYMESTDGTYHHGSPDSFPGLITLEPLWKNKVKTGSIKSIANSGTIDFAGHFQSREVTISCSDGNLNNSGRCRTATIVYNISNNTWQITNTSSLYGVFCVKLTNGYIDTQVIDAGGTATLTPIDRKISGYTSGFIFQVAASRVIKDGSNNVSVLADTMGGWANQGYAVRGSGGGRPAYNATLQNSLPGITFTAASSHVLQGELMKCLQGKSKFTRITVFNGVVLSHGASGTENTQTAFSGGSYFDVVANGAGTNGAYAGAASFLVRVIIYDGTQSTNATKLIVRENKAAKTLTFTGTIPSTTESNSSSVFRMGEVSYTATFIGGSILYDAVIPDVAMNSTEADAAADTLKTLYAI